MRVVLFFFFIAGLLSCTKPKQRHNDILKIELARCGAWADPGAAISIDTSLNYKYYGKIGEGRKQYYIGKIDQAFWDTLNAKFEMAHYKTFNKSDSMVVADAHYFELIIHWNGGKNRIIKFDSVDTNDTLLNAISWLDSSYKTVKLNKTDSIKFETVLQSPPKVDIVSFPILPPKHSSKSR